MIQRSLRSLLAGSSIVLLGGLAAAQDLAFRPGRSAVRMTLLSAQVEIVDGVATTTLKQTLHNDGARPAEATWLLPLPAGAVADDFRMTVGGVQMEGDVLDAELARRVYEGIVRRKRDPGLLEYMGRGCLRARIFPIPPRGETEVRASFRQVLPATGGLSHWTLALSAAGLGGDPPEAVVLDLSIRSRRPIKNVFSPSGAVQVIVKDDHTARVSYEGRTERLPDELSVFYGLSEEEFGLDLFSTRRKGEDEGTFMMLISPRREWKEDDVMKKSITFVLDTSGSMAGEKLDQAKRALTFFVSSLRPADRFDVVPFATEPEPFFGEPRPASPENVVAALDGVSGLRAEGGTNIDDSLALGLARQVSGEHVPIVVFLTDGEPTVGQTSTEAILDDARRQNTSGARIFVFGVGTKVDTLLLDRLAEDSGGARDYVREGEDIEVKTSALFAKLSHPVMTDLELAVDGVRLSRVAPASLPVLFQGSRLEILGRYVGAGAHAIRLSGTVRGERHVYVYEGDFADRPVAEHGFLPALWAERRVGILLDAIRLNGPAPELVEEVRRLGTEHHIVTPYTSHLIVEEGLRIAGGDVGPYRGAGDTVPPGGGAGSSSGGRASGAPTGPTTLGAPPRGSDSFFLGRGQKAGPSSPKPPSLDEVSERLRAAGVLPADAPRAELNRLAVEVVREMSAAREELERLGTSSSGEEAVRASLYLSRLMSRGADGSPASLASLFSRRVGDKVFVLKGGVWTDRAQTGDETARTSVEAYSDEYFALLRARPELARYLALSPRMIVVLDGEVFEIEAPPGE